MDNQNAAVKTYTPRKNFYTMAQISKFIRPGAQRIGVSGSVSSLSPLLAFKHEGLGQITIVGINTSGSAATLSGALASLPAVPHLDLYYTSATANLANGGSVAVNNGTFSATIPADCVFTLTGSSGVNVALSNPVNGAQFTAPATIPLAATATTAAGSIALVWFYNGVTPLGESTLAPYGFTWNNVPMGNYALTAVAGDTFGNIGTSAVVNVTVVGPLTQIGVTPANATVAPGGKQQFTATGIYSDGTAQNLTSQATWASSRTAVATINSSGLATGVTAGITTISATLGSVSGNTTLTIQPPPLAITTTSLPSGAVSTTYTTTLAASGGIAPYAWSLAGGTLPPGLTLSSTGVITGTPTTTGTSSFTVRAADSSISAQTATRLLSLTINSAGTSGLIGNTTEGTLTDNLWYNGAWINAGRFQAGSNMMVSTIRAKVAAIPGQYKCAIYSDGSSRPSRLLGSTAEVSNPASGWQSFPLTSSVALTKGSYYWLAIWSGDANARVYYSGNNGTLRWGPYNYGTWPDPVSTTGGGSLNYCIYGTGTGATLANITVAPANPNMLAGATQQFMATGTYSDSSTQNITNQATWRSSNTGVATINASGLATAVAVGTTTISAALAGVTNSTVLTVKTPTTLTSIAVTPANTAILAGALQPFTVTGTYSDSSTQDITSQVTWMSSSTGVATISASGLATAVAAGTTTISAALAGVNQQHGAHGQDAGGADLDRGDTAQPYQPCGNHPAVHGDRNLFRRHRSKLDEPGDVGFVEDSGGDHQLKRFGYRSNCWNYDYFGDAGECERQHDADDSAAAVGDHDDFVAERSGEHSLHDDVSGERWDCALRLVTRRRGIAAGTDPEFDWSHHRHADDHRNLQLYRARGRCQHSRPDGDRFAQPHHQLRRHKRPHWQYDRGDTDGYSVVQRSLDQRRPVSSCLQHDGVHDPSQSGSHPRQVQVRNLLRRQQPAEPAAWLHG